MPAGLLEARLTYTSSEDTLETLERHLRESIEADTIARLQVRDSFSQPCL